MSQQLNVTFTQYHNVSRLIRVEIDDLVKKLRKLNDKDILSRYDRLIKRVYDTNYEALSDLREQLDKIQFH